MPFYLDTNPDPSEVSDAINYLLSNFSTGVTSDVATGQISGPTGNVIGYLYKYMAVKYADSFDGSLNFSNSPTGRTYYGLRNNNSAAESSNPADYVWYQAVGGFGTTKSLWYICTGGRQIQFAVATSAPDTGWLVDPGSSIDLDVVTSGNIPVIAEAFVAYFTPTILQVPRSGSPLTPSFTGIVPVMYATDKGAVVPFTDAQTDSNVAFVNGSWRIGNSATTGYGDISYTNLTIGNPTDAGDYAQWPNPTAMAGSPAYITVPVRYKNSLGVVSQAGVATLQLVFSDPGAAGQQGSSLDISGYTSFVQNAGGAFTPPSATLSALIQNVTSPTYSWAISGATPTSATTSSVVVTPTSSSTGISVTLTVNGSNLSTPLVKTINMPVVYDGTAGQAGQNGVMSAFPTIYIWTGSSTPPTRPTTTSTYTWSGGSYSAPSGWSTTAPSNTTAGNYLWSITVPLNATATTTTSVLDWTNVSYPIRCIAYNGANGANGTNGTNGTNGSNGSATFVITRYANDGSPPTNTEVNTLLGRNPVAGDICTVSYNNYNNAVVYQYTTSWVLFTTYITGSLIVQNTITADKMVANLMSSDNVLTRGLTVRDNSGNIILAAGTPLNYSNITASSGWLNSNITVNANGTLSGAGSGQVTLSGIGYTGATNATRNQITYSNTAPVSPYSGDIWIDTTNAQYIVKTYNGSVWTNASNYTTNTNQLTDGALLGQTALWTSVSSRPANLSALTGTEAIQNSLITINANGTLSGAGSGQVSLGGLGAGGFALLNQITAANASTYIAGAAIGTAQVGILTAANIGAGTIDASKIAANTITAGQIAANTITAANMNVSQLSAITANLGTITAGSISGTSLSVGSSPAVSGTTMTGSGAIVNSTGTFALGNSTTNVSFNGTQMTLNGNVVATGNINANAVTATAGSALATNQSLSARSDLCAVTLDSLGNPIFLIGLAAVVAPTYTVTLTVYLNDGTSDIMAISVYVAPGQIATVPINLYIPSPGSGSKTYKLAAQATYSGGAPAFALSQQCTLLAIGTKR